MMMIKKALYGAVFAGLLASSTTYADPDNECGLLEIQIANMTNKVCVLDSKNVIHGSEITEPPIGIMPGDSKSFMLKQAFMGPRIEVTYICGEQKITLESQQNKCMLWAGAVVGQKNYEELDLTADFKGSRGSKFFNHPGHIDWIIKMR